MRGARRLTSALARILHPRSAMPPLRWFMPLSTSLFLAACQEKKTASLPPPPTPAPTRIEAPVQKERLNVDEAMTLKDVTFALRAGTPVAELAAEIARRGVMDRVDDAAAKELLSAGATPAVLMALQDPRNILTIAERARSTERAARRTKR